ncbi:MAG: 50S ribosomal protein L17 [Phycisphaerae bacterium]|nr:50S ribosomal protein L17 [Phycisphaerae bacterium]
MRHRKAGYKLGRTPSHRRAMLRNMAASLFEHGQITTTIPKAKALQPFVEKIVTKAKKGGLHNRRVVVSMLGGDRNSFAWSHVPAGATEDERSAVENQRERVEAFFDIPPADSIERNRYGELRKAPKLVRHIFENVAPRFDDREGGYTRIVKLGMNRLGDGGELCVIQFVGAEEGPEIGGRLSTRRRTADRRTAFAAKLRKESGSKAPAAEAPKAEEPAAEESAGGDETTSES